MPDIQEQFRDGDEINLRHLFLKLIRGWKIFAGSLIVLIALGFVYMKIALPVYEAETSILIKDNKSASPGNIEDFLDADIFNTSRNLSSEIGILQSRTVVYDAAKHINMDVSYFGINTFSRQPLFGPCPFRVEYEWVHNNFYDNPFFLHMKDNGTFALKTEKNSVDYEYNKNHRLGEKISTPYFTLRILTSDSSES